MTLCRKKITTFILLTVKKAGPKEYNRSVAQPSRETPGKAALFVSSTITGSSRCVGKVISDVCDCVCVCPRSERKSTSTINTKLGRHKLEFHDADTDTDIDILADILARIVARISACRSACHRNNFRKSRVLDVSVRILARMSVSMSASWNASYNMLLFSDVPFTLRSRARDSMCGVNGVCA